MLGVKVSPRVASDGGGTGGFLICEAHICVHAAPRHLRLEPLIQSQDVNEMKSLPLIGARWGRREGRSWRGSHVCISGLVFLFLCMCVFL